MSQKYITQHVFNLLVSSMIFYFRQRAQYNAFPSVFGGVTEYRRKYSVYVITCWNNFCRPEFYHKIDVWHIVDTYIINKTISH